MWAILNQAKENQRGLGIQCAIGFYSTKLLEKITEIYGSINPTYRKDMRMRNFSIKVPGVREVRRNAIIDQQTSWDHAKAFFKILQLFAIAEGEISILSLLEGTL